MTSRVLDLGACIEQKDLALLQPFAQFGGGDTLECVALRAIGVQCLLHFGQLRFRHGAQFQPQPGNAAVCQPVADVDAFACTGDKPALLQPLQVLRGVGDAHLRLGGQFLHGARRLHQQVDQFEPVWVRQRLSDLGKQSVQRILLASLF